MKRKIAITMFVFIIVGIALALSAYAILATKIEAKELERFKSIPPKPNDFDAYTREIWGGGLTDLCEVSKNYYEQPEFYGNSWNIAKKEFYDSPDYSKWGVYGQGNIPREISYSFSNLKKGHEFELCTFFHNGFGIWTYQGFKLEAEESEYFDIIITPNELTMTPTFPVFEEGWTKKISIKLIVKEDIPQGSYIIKLNAVQPSPEYSREQNRKVLSLEIDKEEYKKECIRFLKDDERCNYLINLREKKYVEGGTYQTNEPLLKVIVNVK
jgi:hypothetical protein